MGGRKFVECRGCEGSPLTHMAKTPGLKDAFEWPQIMLFGDSLTQCGFSQEGQWLSMLADKSQRKCDVLNRGFYGYNSRWNKLILPKLVTAQQIPNICAFTVLLGTNDANLKHVNDHLHVPTDEYRDNLVYMVEYLQSIGLNRNKVIFISPPPLDEDTWKRVCQKDGYIFSKSNEDTKKYAYACKSAATECGVEFLDLYTEMMSAQDWQSFLSDGLHFSVSGSTFFFELLWPLVEKRTRHLRGIFPDWSDINNDNPEAVLPRSRPTDGASNNNPDGGGVK